MSDKEMELHLLTRHTYCPICGDRLADHAVEELGNCHHRKQLKDIFRKANAE